MKKRNHKVPVTTKIKTRDEPVDPTLAVFFDSLSAEIPSQAKQASRVRAALAAAQQEGFQDYVLSRNKRAKKLASSSASSSRELRSGSGGLLCRDPCSLPPKMLSDEVTSMIMRRFFILFEEM